MEPLLINFFMLHLLFVWQMRWHSIAALNYCSADCCVPQRNIKPAAVKRHSAMLTKSG